MTNNALRLPDWEIIAVGERGDVVEVTARYLPFPDACTKCGVVEDGYYSGRPAILEWEARRIARDAVRRALDPDSVQP